MAVKSCFLFFVLSSVVFADPYIVESMVCKGRIYGKAGQVEPKKRQALIRVESILSKHRDQTWIPGIHYSIKWLAEEEFNSINLDEISPEPSIDEDDMHHYSKPLEFKLDENQVKTIYSVDFFLHDYDETDEVFLRKRRLVGFLMHYWPGIDYRVTCKATQVFRYSRQNFPKYSQQT